MMSDEPIPWESEVVGSVLSQANERYERRYELKHQEYELDCQESCRNLLNGNA
ncbi:MAG: hypothetical protein J7K02_00620 [Deltaproteobacteria bacterium]|nr:hypothetical protein [Deltaproteobacteria bacterium]